MSTLNEYLESAHSPEHVVKYVAKTLDEAGFSELDASEKFVLESDKGYYCMPYPSALIAFKLSNKITTGRMHIACAHTDSPSLKIKPNASLGERANAYRINVEPYGGALSRTWFDRPLGFAGKLIVKGDNIYEPATILIDSEAPYFIIPSLAPHMDREIESKKVDPQKELIPICAIASFEKQFESNDKAISADFLDVLARMGGVKKEDILDFDLNLYCFEKPTLCGIDGELLLASRIDNVASVAALVEGLISSSDNDCIGDDSKALFVDDLTHIKEVTLDDNDISIIALFDNEEVGSRSKQGADSMLLSMVIDKIFASSLLAECDKTNAIFKSKMLSVDGAHAVHPNYPEKADETSRAYLGKGVVLKISASQRYVSDAKMSGILTALCDKYKIGLQKQANKSGTPGGQTLGPIESSYLPIPAADLGVPMLAMHSIMETMCISDYDNLKKLMTIWL